MSKWFWLIDAGHGGIDASGHYTTAPAKMVKYPDGLVIYEGFTNRRTAVKLMRKLREANIDYVQISDDVIDMSLEARVHKADAIFKSDKRCVFLSIHSNASPDPTKPGKGLEVWTSKGQTKSDKFAQVFAETYAAMLPQFQFRKDLSDHDWDREADFFVLRKTDCPSLLVENLFMDNRAEAEYLLSDAGQEQLAEVLFQAIKKCEALSI